MKHLFTFLMIIGCAQHLSAQWVTLNSATTNDLHDVAFLNEEYGIAVGEFGTILKTVDGGSTWINMNFPAFDNFNAVALSGTDTIYVAGTGTISPTIYRSADGGINWQKVLLDNSLLSVCTASDGDVYAAADFIYHSSDGGENWMQPYTLSPTVNAFSIQATDNQTICMGGNVGGIITYSAIVARSVNGGNSFWDFDVFSFPNANALTAFSFIHPDTGYFFMNDFDFFNANDSSQLIRVFNFQLVPGLGNDSVWIFNYQPLNLLFDDYVNDCKFFKSHAGYAVGPNGIVYRSTDGGENWSHDFTGSNELFALSMLDENNGYAVGAVGTILKLGGGATAIEQVNKTLSNLTVYPNPAKDKIMISFLFPKEDVATLQLMDVNSKICMLMEGIHLSNGTNEIGLDVSSLPSAVYMLNILANEMVLRKTLEVFR